MANDPVFFLLKGPDYPHFSEVNRMLGRVVKSYGNPFRAYVPADGSIFRSQPVRISSPMTNAEYLMNKSHHSGFRAILSAAFGFSKKSENEVSAQLAGKAIWTIRLQGYDGDFELMADDAIIGEELGQWLPAGKHRQAYMIVGVLMGGDMTVGTTMHQMSEIEGEGHVNLNTILTAAGAPPPIDAGEARLEMDNKNTANATLKGDSKGAHVFGIEYCCVRRKVVSTFGEFTLRDTPKYGDDDRTFGDHEHGGDDATSESEDDVQSEVDDDSADWVSVLLCEKEDSKQQQIESDEQGQTDARKATPRPKVEVSGETQPDSDAEDQRINLFIEHVQDMSFVFAE